MLPALLFGIEGVAYELGKQGIHLLVRLCIFMERMERTRLSLGLVNRRANVSTHLVHLSERIRELLKHL